MRTLPDSGTICAMEAGTHMVYERTRRSGVVGMQRLEPRHATPVQSGFIQCNLRTRYNCTRFS